MTRVSILIGSLVLVAATGVSYSVLRLSADLRRVSRQLDALAREVTTMGEDLAAVADDISALAEDVNVIANGLNCEEEPQEHVPLRGRGISGPAAAGTVGRGRARRAYELHQRVRALAQ